jgi:hypothetical protein
MGPTLSQQHLELSERTFSREIGVRRVGRDDSGDTKRLADQAGHRDDDEEECRSWIKSHGDSVQIARGTS